MSLQLWMAQVLPRLRSLIFRRQVEQDLTEEFEYHLEMKTRECIEHGMSPAEARYAAIRAMGGMEQSKERCRDARGMRWIREMISDCRYALRTLAKNPGFAVAAILLLALGIGANTAIVSIMDALIFRRLPFVQMDRLVSLTPGLNYQNYLDFRAEDRVYSDVAAIMELPVSGTTLDSGSISGRAVSSNFFRTVGLPMTLGRGFMPEEAELPSGRSVAVLSYRFWKEKFGGDPAVVGRILRLNTQALTIVGVAPKDLPGDLRASGPCHDIWVPIPMLARIAGIDRTPMWREATGDRHIYPFLSIVGRLHSGITVEKARARLRVFWSGLEKAYPGTVGQKDAPELVPMNEARWPKGEALFLSAVMLAAGLCILLITCTNLAGLLMARGLARQREIATRLAIGASRARVMRQLLAEGLVLSMCALAASLLVYCAAIRLFFAMDPFNGAILYADLGVGVRSFLFALCIGLLSALICSLAPAITATGHQLSSALRDRIFLCPGFRKPRLFQLLVISQLVLTLILLVGGGLLARTVWHFLRAETGFDRNVQVFSHRESRYQPDNARTKRFFKQVLERTRELPGVRSAAWGLVEPFDPPRYMAEQVQPDRAQSLGAVWLDVQGNSVSPGYFETLKISIVEGRDFSRRDMRNPAGMVIVNETTARRFWPGESAIGKQIRIRRQSREEFRSKGPELCEVIGVAKDVKYKTPWEDKMPYIYFPYWHWFYQQMSLYVSVEGNAQPVTERIRKIYEEADPGISIANVHPVSSRLESLLSQERSAMYVLGAFGLLGLILAATGLYGIEAYSVAQRTREFSIRMALGAEAGSIIRNVMFEGLKMGLIGLAFGLPASMALSRYISSRMHGLSALDPITYVAVSAVCVGVSVIAAYMPGRRAAANRVDSLRVE